MDRTGILTFNGIEVYGTIVPHSVGLRFRCWTREWETLGFFDGQTLGVAHDNEPERPLMVASIAVLENGNAWIEFAPPIHAPKLPLRPARPRSRRWIPG